MSGNFRPGSLNQKTQIYFEKITDSETDKTHKCLIETCKKQLKATKLCNLVNHVRTVHPLIFKEISEVTEEDKNYFKIKRLKFIQNCAELVTINMRPFNILHDSAFIKLNEDTLQKLADAGMSINLKDKNHLEIKEYIATLTQDLVKYIHNDVKDDKFSLMVDITTKNNISFVGISIQYPKDVGKVTRCIGITPILEKNSGSNILKTVKKCLERYQLSISQISAVTTDNGKNMIAMINLMNDDTDDDNGNQDIVDLNLIDPANVNNVNETANEYVRTPDEVNDELLQRLTEEFEQMDDDEFNNYLSRFDPDQDDNERNLESFVSTLTNEARNIVGIKCASHTLQLAVKDAISTSNAAILIRFIRAIVKLLRQKSKLNEIRTSNIDCIVPRIDCDTRWSYTYIMVIIFFIFYSKLNNQILFNTVEFNDSSTYVY